MPLALAFRLALFSSDQKMGFNESKQLLFHEKPAWNN